MGASGHPYSSTLSPLPSHSPPVGSFRIPPHTVPYKSGRGTATVRHEDPPDPHSPLPRPPPTAAHPPPRKGPTPQVSYYPQLFSCQQIWILQKVVSNQEGPSFPRSCPHFLWERRISFFRGSRSSVFPFGEAHLSSDFAEVGGGCKTSRIRDEVELEPSCGLSKVTSVDPPRFFFGLR